MVSREAQKPMQTRLRVTEYKHQRVPCRFYNQNYNIIFTITYQKYLIYKYLFIVKFSGLIKTTTLNQTKQNNTRTNNTEYSLKKKNKSDSDLDISVSNQKKNIRTTASKRVDEQIKNSNALRLRVNKQNNNGNQEISRRDRKIT